MRSNKDRSVNAQKNQLDRPIATQSPLIKIHLTEHEGEFLIALECANTTMFDFQRTQG